MRPNTRRRCATHSSGPLSTRGTALLEVIVALTILTVAGLSAMVMANQATVAVAQARDADRETRRASGFLDAIALWPRTDLDRHLGDRREGAWILTVDRPFSTLYTVALRASPDSAHGQPFSADLVRTVLYRPEPRGAP
jgi:type II secretory pathway pseudopilin PulG